MTTTHTTRFTYHRTDEKGVVEVREHGQPIGQLSRTRHGYELRDLDGAAIDQTYGVSRPVAASALSRKQTAAYREATSGARYDA